MNELIPNPEDRIVCVKVGKLQRENMYEMARKYWKVRYERVSNSCSATQIARERMRRTTSLMCFMGRIIELASMNRMGLRIL